MKKTLVTLAILAASGASFAQVTLSGKIDLFLGTNTSTLNGTDTTTAGIKDGQTGLTNGGLAGSRWALNGSEDLGGGLKAMFKLENRHSPDTGTDGGGFGGDAYVALGGGFGTVKLGRTYTAFDDARAVSNMSNVFDSSFTPAVGGATDYTGRGKNGIRYESPSFGGVTAALSYSMGEDATATVGASSITSMHVAYAAGPLTAALGYQDEATPGVATTANEKYTQLSVAYDFGVASVSGGYETRAGTTATGDDKGWNIGLNVPVGAINASIGYATETTDVAGAQSLKISGWGLGATYTMSKRTTLYTGWTSSKGEQGANEGKTSLFGLGVMHNF
jgi:predicted porin